MAPAISNLQKHVYTSTDEYLFENALYHI